MSANGTRESILDAAEKLIGVLGYSKTTMDDVARAAGVGKRTIYVHFPSKEEVVLSTIDRIVERLVERLRAHAAAAGSAAERIRDMLVERVLFRFDSAFATIPTGLTNSSRRCGRRTSLAARSTSRPRPACSPMFLRPDGARASSPLRMPGSRPRRSSSRPTVSFLTP